MYLYGTSRSEACSDRGTVSLEKCDKRKEVSRFDIFSGLMLERKEYRSLLQYRFNRVGGKTFAEGFVSWDGNALY